jgi:hypothetical protein
MGWNPFSGRGLIDIGTLGGSRLLGEDTMSKIPGLNAIGGYQPDSQKALIKKQEELAKDAELQKKKNQQARMQALGQSMLAFNPQNQMMAQMFGPQAAFSPQQFAQMGADPSVAGMPWGSGTDEQRRAQAADAARRKKIEQQMTPLGPGPAPLNLPRPQAGRRY